VIKGSNPPCFKIAGRRAIARPFKTPPVFLLFMIDDENRGRQFLKDLLSHFLLTTIGKADVIASF